MRHGAVSDEVFEHGEIEAVQNVCDLFYLMHELGLSSVEIPYKEARLEIIHAFCEDCGVRKDDCICIEISRGGKYMIEYDDGASLED